LYDILAGSANMESSYVLGKGKALEAFPMLKKDGLTGAVVYYDGARSLPSSLPGTEDEELIECVVWARAGETQASTTTRG
jgi:hypothetical protein